MRKTLRMILVVYSIGTAVTLGVEGTSGNARLRNATMAFREIMSTPEKGIPRELFERSECVVLVPGLKKGAFGVGGKYGRGFASCRKNKTNWGPPAAVRIEGGSFGLQLGASSTDVLMLVMNRSGMNRLLSDKFTIGGEASAAAGPVGRQTSANTDILLRAEILSWSRSRGLFAGLSLEGATLRPDTEENEKLYGRALSNKEILQGELSTPRAARTLIGTLERFSRGTTLASRQPHQVSKSLSTSGRATLGEREVHFATGEADVPSHAEAALSEAVKALKDNPDWKLQVEGYTDNVGSESFNEDLSKRRATSVINWLADRGVDRSRLNAKGEGESHPVGDNSTDDGRAKNRRVELVRR
jgi:lipid-binding SYLF domain-containing protein